MPAKSAGTHLVQVTTGGVLSNTLQLEARSPAQENLTGWLGGRFAGAPWNGKASAGTSGGNALTEPTNPMPAIPVFT